VPQWMPADRQEMDLQLNPKEGAKDRKGRPARPHGWPRARSSVESNDASARTLAVNLRFTAVAVMSICRPILKRNPTDSAG